MITPQPFPKRSDYRALLRRIAGYILTLLVAATLAACGGGGGNSSVVGNDPNQQDPDNGDPNNGDPNNGDPNPGTGGSNLPIDPVSGIPTTGSAACLYILDEDITSPTQLVNSPSACDYVLDGWVEVRSDLLIEPGVGIRANANATLVIEGGRVIADGTAELPIVMDGQAHTAGFWNGINFRNGRESVFDHFHVADAGQVCAILFCPDVGFILDEVTVSFTNSSVSNSYVIGMNITDDTELTAFSNNRFFGNGSAGLVIGAENVPMMDAESDYSGGSLPNAIPMLRVSNGGHNQGRVYRWKKLSSPYYIPSYFDPAGGRWIIEPGVEIVMGEEAWITIEGNAVVEAVGTAAEPIIIRGNQPNSGYWKNIRFRDSPWESNRFEHVDIRHWGNRGGVVSAFSAFDLNDSRMTLDNVSITNGRGAGVLCDEPTLFSDGSFVRLVSNVRIDSTTSTLVDSDCQDF